MPVHIEHFYDIASITQHHRSLGIDNPFPEMQGYAYWLTISGPELDVEETTEWAKEQFPDAVIVESLGTLGGWKIQTFYLKNNRDATVFRLSIS